MTQPIGYGIDLSHHQDSHTLPWASWLGKVDFVIARAGYGRTRDRQVGSHVTNARDIGAKVGLYVFFRVVESVADQLANLKDVAARCGIDGRDIVPAVDIEADGDRAVEPSWSAPAKEFVDQIVETWGNAIIYTTQREFGLMGSPSWILRRPLWVAHWTAAASPATPAGVPATIWQHRVGSFEPAGVGGYFNVATQIDQNRLLRPLPLVGAPVTLDEQERIENQVAAFLTSEREKIEMDGFPHPDAGDKTS